MDETRCEYLSIGQFAMASGLSLKALRIYHEKGLLEPAHVDPFTNYRYYRSAQVNVAHLIKLMRSAEIPLATIQKVIELHVTESPEAEQIVRAHLESFESRVQVVRKFSDKVLRQLRHEEFPMSFDVVTSQIEAQMIVSISKRIKVAQLGEHINGSLETLHAYLSEQGGEISGAPFGIYHGPVNHEDDGPVEVCLPVSGEFMARGDVQVRELAGGPAAVVDATGENCDFPAILGAYDAASKWIQKNGHQIADSPRETWFKHSGDDEHLQIVWPYR